MEMKKTNYWSTQIPYNSNRLDATTSFKKLKQELKIHQHEENDTNTSAKQARDINENGQNRGT